MNWQFISLKSPVLPEMEGFFKVFCWAHLRHAHSQIDLRVQSYPRNVWCSIACQPNTVTFNLSEKKKTKLQNLIFLPKFVSQDPCLPYISVWLDFVSVQVREAEASRKQEHGAWKCNYHYVWYSGCRQEPLSAARDHLVGFLYHKL